MNAECRKQSTGLWRRIGIIAICLVVTACIGCAFIDALGTAPAAEVNADGTITTPADPVGGGLNLIGSLAPLIPNFGGWIVAVIGALQIWRDRRKIIKSENFSAILVELIQKYRDSDPKFKQQFEGVIEKILSKKPIALEEYSALVTYIKDKYGIGIAEVEAEA